MPQKMASFIALIGMLLLSVVMAADLVKIITAYLHNVVPVLSVFRAAVYVLASAGVTVFFWAYNTAHES